MTIEQKAKAYDEAIERAREIKRTYPQDKVCETIFPELKESEDERIRKIVINLLKQSTYENCMYEGVKMKDIYAWLEKQSEQKQTMDYSDSLPKDNWELVHEFVEKFGRIPKDEDELNALVEYVLKRQKSIWSEEDEKMYSRICYLIHAAAFENYDVDDVGKELGEYAKITDWLKILRPQNAYNPYKEVVESIAEMCKHYDKASHSGLRDFYDNVNVKCKDAKEYDSLFPQNTWKPSDEQIQAVRLVRVFVTDVLLELKEQLKKLKGE